MNTPELARGKPMISNNTIPNGVEIDRKPDAQASGCCDLLPAVPYDQYEQEILELIKERDYWCDKATELANDIGEALGFDVGEHTSANCPVQSAIDGLLEMSDQIEEWKGR